MNTSKLKKNMIIKNYRVFCDLIEEPIKTNGNSRKLQLKNWGNYIKFKRIPNTQGYKILQIYDTPKATIPRPGNKSIYIPHIETILTQYLMNQKEFSASLSKLEIIRLLGMVNDHFGDKGYETKLALSLFPDGTMGVKFLRQIKSIIYKSLTDILHSTLRSMVMRGIIKYNYVLYCVDQSGNVHCATQEAFEDIKLLKKSILRKMGYSSLHQVYYENKSFLYYRNLTSELNSLYGFQDIYQNFDIVYLQNIKRLGLKKVKEMKTELNTIVSTSIAKTVNKYVRKYIHFNDQTDAPLSLDAYKEKNEKIISELLFYF